MNKHGFTLLEVTLFLAIAGALSLIAFIGLGPRLRNVRFTQSTRAVEASVNAEFAASAVGENARPDNFGCEKATYAGVLYPRIFASNGTDTTTGSSAQCIINGRVAIFNGDHIVYYSVVSLTESVGNAATCATVSFETVRDCYKARFARGVVPSFNINEPPAKKVINYGNGVTAQSNVQNEGVVLGFGYLQNPKGVDKYPFFYTKGENAVLTAPALSATSTTQGSVTNPRVCFTLGSRQAELSFTTNNLKPSLAYKECSV